MLCFVFIKFGEERSSCFDFIGTNYHKWDYSKDVYGSWQVPKATYYRLGLDLPVQVHFDHGISKPEHHTNIDLH